MESLYVFTVITKDECNFTINLLFKDLETGEQELLTGLNESDINNRVYDTVTFNRGRFKVGDKGLMTYKSSMLGDLDFKFYTLDSMRMSNNETRVTSKDNHIFYDNNGRIYMLPVKFNTITEAVLVNVPDKLKHDDGVTLLDDVCTKVDNDIIKVKEFNGRKVTEDNHFAESMRKRANRLVGLFDE